MGLIALVARWSDVLFIAAVAAMFVRIYAAQKGNIRLAVRTSWVTLVASIPLALLSLAMTVLGVGGVISLLMTAMWSYNAHVSWQEIRRWRGRS